jgi:hypothetical protein
MAATGLEEKYPLRKEGSDPFVDPRGYKTISKEQDFRAELARTTRRQMKS